MIRICYINLDRATQRRRQMEAEADRVGLVFERSPAVAADSIDPAQMRALGGRWERPLSGPELACFLSHHALWQRVAETGEAMLILEDDARLSPKLKALCEIEQLSAVGDMDLLNLEDFGRRRFVARAVRPLAAGLRRVRVYRDKAGAAAYILWPSGARKLLEKTRREGPAPADAFIHSCGALVSWQCLPALAIQAEVLLRRNRGAPDDVPPTSIQAPRARLALAPRHWRFFVRRAAAQARLLPHHLHRLVGAAYREVRVDPEDFPPDAQSRS